MCLHIDIRHVNFIKKVVLFMFQTMVDNVVSISLTGHRPDKLAGYDLSKPYYTRLRNRLIAIIEHSLAKYDIVECHSGMALGADTVWAQAIVYCKEKYGSDKIKFVAEIPDYNQPSRWLQESKDEWSRLMSYADSVNTYQLNNGRSYAYVLNQRNIGMIKTCDILIAIYDGVSTGGTANGVKDGKKMGKYITYIDPKTV